MSSRLLVALLILSSCRGAFRRQYGDREWYALLAVPSQELDAAKTWVSIDGTAYPVVSAKLASPVGKGPLQSGQLGVVESELWGRATDENGNRHSTSVLLQVVKPGAVEVHKLEIEVDSDQPCSIGQEPHDITVRGCDDRLCSKPTRLEPVGDGLYRAGDIRVAITVVCARKKPE